MSQESPNRDLSLALPFSEHWVDLRIISTMRLILAFSALLAISIDPSEPTDSAALTYTGVIVYTIYSLLIYLLSARRSKMLHPSRLHWLDVAWYIALIALSGGTNSIFFFFLFFPILVASFGWGYASGLRVTVVSTLFFVIVAYASNFLEQPFVLNRFLLRYVSLLVLGYLIAFWSGLQSRLKARLKVLKEVSLLSNPRFGVDRTILSVLESLRSSYQADFCLLILPKSQVGQPKRLYGSISEGPYILHRADRNSLDAGNSFREITEDLARALLTTSLANAVIYRSGRPGEILLYDTKTGLVRKDHSENYAFVSAFEGKSCFSVPVQIRNQLVGRLYIVGGKHGLDFADVDFVLQVIEQVTQVLENIRLVDSLASEAAGQERRKIGQDIHDSVIQPYIGLQLGLLAVRQKLESGENVLDDVKELLELTNGEVADLRSYVGGLRRGESPRDIFLPAVRRFASRFSEATGLNVEVNASADLPIYDRLAAELFQMIEEGLSNVRRHSTSTYARVEIDVKDGNLEMRLRNERVRRLGEASFTPVSISERAAALGGQTLVYTDKNFDTVVCVQIPL